MFIISFSKPFMKYENSEKVINDVYKNLKKNGKKQTQNGFSYFLSKELKDRLE